MKVRVQVLATGEIEEGENQYTKRKWYRKTFQVFTEDHQAGNIQVYGEEEDLKQLTKPGIYDATIACQGGNRARIEPRFVSLIPAAPTQPAK